MAEARLVPAMHDTCVEQRRGRRALREAERLVREPRAVFETVVQQRVRLLELGASAMQRTADVPSEMVLITEALILLFLLFSDVVGARLRRSSR